MNCELAILRESDSTSVPDDGAFQTWVNAALGNKAASLAIRIVDEPESRAMNLRYRKQDKPTNVLSFPTDLPPVVSTHLECPPLGDLVICAAIVRSEALAQNKAETDHWAHLTVHGVLHLRGFDHENELDAQLMEQHEIDLLAGLGIPDPYNAKS